MVEFVHAISHKLSGLFVRFTAWFGSIMIYIMIRNGFDLYYDSERFRSTSWFGTVSIHIMIWNGFDPHYDLERFWFTTWFVVHISGVPRTNVLGIRQTVYIDTRVIPDRYIYDLSDGTLLLAFLYIFLIRVILLFL